MMRATELTVCSLILLTIAVKPGSAAEQQFSCKGQVIDEGTNPAVQSKPIDLNVTLGDKNKLSVKTSDGKTLAPASPAITRYNLSLRRMSLLESISTIRAICFSFTPLANWRG